MGPTATTKTAEYSYYGTDKLHSVLVGTKEHFAFDDALGSVVALVDTGKTVTRKYAFDEWGKLTGGADFAAFNNADRVRWKGALWLGGPEADLYYMRRRWYETGTGRFLSEDPLGVRGGQNPVTYAGGDPVNRSDPGGRCFLYLNHYIVFGDTGYLVGYECVVEDGGGGGGLGGGRCRGSLQCPRPERFCDPKIKEEARKLMRLSNSDGFVEYGEEVNFGKSGFRFGPEIRGEKGKIPRDRIHLSDNAVAFLHSHPNDGNAQVFQRSLNVSSDDVSWGYEMGVYVLALNTSGELSMSFYWSPKTSIELASICGK